MDGIQFQDAYDSCMFESQFIRETPKYSLISLEGLEQAFEIHKKAFPDGFEPVESR